MADAFPHAPLYSPILEAWRRERAWMRYVISVRRSQFEAAYLRRMWRVYLVEQICRRHALEPDPIHPVPGAPPDYRDNPGLTWTWRQSGVAPGRVTRKTGEDANKPIPCWWPWPNGVVPTVPMLCATKMKEAQARACIADMQVLDSMVQRYHRSRLRLLDVFGVLGWFGRSRGTAGELAQQLKSEAQTKQEKLNQKAQKHLYAPKEDRYAGGILLGWPDQPQEAVPSFPASWPNWSQERSNAIESKANDDIDPDVALLL